jgi:hypothetical protein
MGRCAHCNKFIIGGKKQGALRYCNDACYQQGFLAVVADQQAPGVVAARLEQYRQQACPICGGEGPIDVYTSHTAWSALVLTSWKSKPRLSCVECGRSEIRKAMAFTVICGWWGFPFGLVVTPWQLMNNVKALKKARDPSQSSSELQQLVKLEVASALQAQATKQPTGGT